MKDTSLIHLWSLRRSGAHGVMGWLAAHFDNVIIRNNAGEPTRYPTNENCSEIVGLEDKIPELTHAGKSLMVIRNPYNLIASRHKEWSGNTKGYPYATDDPEYLRDDIQLWKDFVLTAYNLEGPDARVVVFEKWFTSENYRRDISAWLGLEFTDAGLNKVNNIYDSSFDGTRYDGKAQEMPVLTRYKSIIDNPYFQPLFQDVGLELTYENVKEK